MCSFILQGVLTPPWLTPFGVLHCITTPLGCYDLNMRMSVLTNTYLIFNCAYAKYGNYIFRSFLGNVCCKAVKFRMKLSCSGYVQHGYLHVYIWRNFLWKLEHISWKVQCEVLLLEVVGRFSYLRNEKLDHFLFCSMLPTQQHRKFELPVLYTLQNMTALESQVSDELQVKNPPRETINEPNMHCNYIIDLLSFPSNVC